jgi:hypothetical protein
MQDHAICHQLLSFNSSKACLLLCRLCSFPAVWFAQALLLSGVLTCSGIGGFRLNAVPPT